MSNGSEPSGPREPVSLSEIDNQLNFVERALGHLSDDDEYDRAIIQNQASMIRLLAQDGLMTGGVLDGENRLGGPLSNPERSALPLDAVGTTARDINPNDSGPAIFQIRGTIFYTVVQNNDKEEMQAGTSVRVEETGNKVTARGAAGTIGNSGAGGADDTFRYQGRLYSVPDVTRGSEDVKVANQRYLRGTYENVTETLEPGGDLEVARIEPDANEFALLKYTNATAHDTVEYEYYIDGTAEPDPDLSGPSPWATPPDLFEVSPGGFRLVEDFASLRLVETSGQNSYDTFQGTLTGLLIEVQA
jgi:hypothetical protein